MESTQTFKENVRRLWGKQLAVADEALNELFRHGDEIGLDFDDQVRYAKKVGLLAGELKDDNPETFITRFETEILNEE